MKNINNIQDIDYSLVTNETILREFLNEFSKEKFKNRYACSRCGSRDNLIVFTDGVKWYADCKSGCGTYTIIQLVEEYIGLEYIDALKWINDRYNLNIYFEENHELNKLDNFLMKTLCADKEFKYLRHHYYHNEKGDIVAAKVLYKNENGKKRGADYSINSYYATLGGTKDLKVLYNMHKIKEAKPGGVVAICEGEKDADTLSTYGYLATTSRESGKWLREYSVMLEKFDVVMVFSDNDLAGKRYRDKVIDTFKEIWREVNESKSLIVVTIPLEKDKGDISDYIDSLKQTGLNKNEIKNKIKELITYSENVLDVYELHQDQYGIFKWYKDSDENYKKCYIADFNIVRGENVQVITAEGEIQAEIRLNLKPMRKNASEVSCNMEPNKLLDKNAFNQVVSAKTPFIAFTGKADTFLCFRNYVLRYYIPEIPQSYYEISGIRIIKNKVLYVTPNGIMDINGNIYPEVKSLNKSVNRSRLYISQDITKDQLEELLQKLINFNQKHICVNILMYAISSFNRFLYVDQGIKTGDLFLFGTAGSGKSETVSSIIMPLFNSVDSVPINIGAGGTTNFPIQVEPSFDSFTPAILNEYGNADVTTKKRINSMMKYRYDLEPISKGNKQMSIDKYHNYLSPLIVLGEASFEGMQEQAALKDRHIVIMLSKGGRTEKHTENFMWLKQNKGILQSFGKLLLCNAMKQDMQGVVLERDTLIKEIKKQYPILEDRIAGNAATLLQGYSLLKKSCLTLGVNLNEVLKKDEVTNMIVDNFYNENLNSTGYRYTQLDETVKLLIKVVLDNKYKYPWEYDGRFLYIAASAIHDIDSLARNMGKQDIVLNDREFNKMLKNEGYIFCDNKGKTTRTKQMIVYSDEHAFTTKVTRVYCFHMGKIAHLDIVKDLLLTKNIEI